MTAFQIVDTVRGMIASGRHSAARDICEQHLRTPAANAEWHLLKGLLLRMEGRADEAVSAHDIALSFSPDALAAYQEIAGILADKGWFHSALVVMENAGEATTLTPDAQHELDSLRARVDENRRSSAMSMT